MGPRKIRNNKDETHPIRLVIKLGHLQANGRWGGVSDTHAHTLQVVCVFFFLFWVKVNGQVQVYFLEKQQRTEIKLPEKIRNK